MIPGGVEKYKKREYDRHLSVAIESFNIKVNNLVGRTAERSGVGAISVFGFDEYVAFYVEKSPAALQTAIHITSLHGLEKEFAHVWMHQV